MDKIKECPVCGGEVRVNFSQADEDIVPCEECGFVMTVGEWDETLDAED